jgi:hypothetical protein
MLPTAVYQFLLTLLLRFAYVYMHAIHTAE